MIGLFILLDPMGQSAFHPGEGDGDSPLQEPTVPAVSRFVASGAYVAVMPPSTIRPAPFM